MIYLLKKELLEVIRDRRTLFSMLIVPLIAFPAIIGITGYFTKKGVEKISSMSIKIFVYSETLSDTFELYLRDQNLSLVKTTHPMDTVSKESPAAVFIYPGEIEVLYDASSEKGREALRRIQSATAEYKDYQIKESLSRLGVPHEIVEPFKLKVTNLATTQRMFGMSIGIFLGYLLVILMFSSAMYAAIDLTAGEKERRTMEVLLSSVPSRKRIVYAKVSAVSLVAFISSVLLVISWTVSLLYFGGGLFNGELAGFSLLISPGILISFLLLIAPFAVFVASLEVTFASFARSFREAQSYLTPLLMLAILPAIVSILPGMSEWATWKAFVPVMNITSSLKGMLQRELSTIDLLLTITINLIYTGIASVASVYLFSREEILFRE